MLSAIAVVMVGLAQQAPTPVPSPVARVVVTPSEATLVVGDSVRLTAEALDAAGRPVPGARIRFFPSFGASVDSVSGVVRAGTRGVTPIAVMAMTDGTLPSAPTMVNVRILAPPPREIELTPRPTTLLLGQRLSIEARVLAANGDTRDDAVSWSSSAPAIVRVDGRTGRIEAAGLGRATVTAAVGGVASTLDLVVEPNPVRSLEVSGGADVARTGDVLRFQAVARDARGAEVSVPGILWSMAPGSGLIDQDGAFVANEPGTYVVTASLGSTSADAVVMVSPRDVRRPTTTVGRLPLSGIMAAEFWPHPDGRHAYLSTVGDRVYAIDISNPAAPVITDSVVVDARMINDVMSTADGRWGVITREAASSRRNGIVILDLEDPAHPRVVSEYTETVTGGVHSVFVHTQPTHGTHVYLTDDATGSLRVIDLNDPARPREIARWDARPGQAQMLHDLDIEDGLAYLAYWDDGLIILDVGNGMRGGSPANPQLVSQIKYDLDALYRRVEAEGGPGFIRGTHTAWRQGNYVFIGDEVFSATPKGITDVMGLGHANGRLHVVDVSDITQPRVVAWYEPPDGGTHNVWVAGDTLYLGDYQGGLRVLDISGELRGDLLAQGREIASAFTGDKAGFVPNASMAWGAFYHNGLVWVPDMFSGLWVVRVEPPRPPPEPTIF
jgi:hypothetical protein